VTAALAVPAASQAGQLNQITVDTSKTYRITTLEAPGGGANWGAQFDLQDSDGWGENYTLTPLN
jgi:hypothetical protein